MDFMESIKTVALPLSFVVAIVAMAYYRGKEVGYLKGKVEMLQRIVDQESKK